MKYLIAAAALSLALIGVGVQASYYDSAFSLLNNSQCVGGTLLLQFGDVQDTGAAISAKPLATQDCQFLMTGPGQCCQVQYRRSTPAAPAIGSHVFQYEIYQGGTVGPSTPPPGTVTSSFQHWAGVSGPANSCPQTGGGTWQYESSDITDLSCPAGVSPDWGTGPGKRAQMSHAYSAVPDCPVNPEGQACSGPCKINTYAGSACNVNTDIYKCATAQTQATPTTATHTDAEVIADARIKQDVFRAGSFSEGDLRNLGRNAIATRWYLSGDQVSMNRVCTVLDGAGSIASNITRADMASASSVIKIASVYYDGSKWLEIGSRGLIAGDTYLTGSFSCGVTSAGTPVSTSCTNTPPSVTAVLVANPNAIETGESSLLTWSSQNATECTGTNFNTGGDDAGSTLVSPSQTTAYSVTCTNSASSASANTTVTVTEPNDPDPEFAVSCRAHPSSVGINEDVLWSSTVTGPVGAYTYSWGGTDGLSGNGNQVFKKYASSGSKSGQLTVTFAPNIQLESAPAQTPPPASPSTPPPTSPTQPITSIPSLPPGTICPAIGWVTPVTPCSGVWAPTYSTGGCQSGWQCQASTGDSGGGGSIVQPEDTSIIDSILDFFQYDSNFDSQIPEIQTVDGSVLGATTGNYWVDMGYLPGKCVTQTCPLAVETTVDPISCSTLGATCQICTGGVAGSVESSINLYECKAGVTTLSGGDGGGGTSTTSGPQTISVQCENSVSVRAPQCLDGVDNNGDGNTDYPDDPGCTSDDDDDETSEDEDDLPQCSDTEDNDGDGMADYPADPGCVSPDDDNEYHSQPQCSDGIDNDGDGDADAADPGCNVGSGSGGGGGGGTYNPNGTSESGGGGSGTAQCSDNVDNNGDGNIDYPDDPGCSSPDDNLEFVEPADVTFTADPPLVKKNQSCTLTLSARSVSSCSLTGPGLSRSFTAVGGLISLKEVVTPSLAQSSTFTLSCNGLDGKRTSKSVDCKIAPTFEEF